jgi:hypothetical protein
MNHSNQPDDLNEEFIPIEPECVAYTVASTPPVDGGSQRRSYWTELFDECRSYPNQWRRTARSFTRSTAAQIASDVRNMARRDPSKLRLRGFKPGDRWEAVWGVEEDATEPGEFYLWLRFLEEPF